MKLDTLRTRRTFKTRPRALVLMENVYINQQKIFFNQVSNQNLLYCVKNVNYIAEKKSE